MAESFELPDETDRLRINLEDDVRDFLLQRLPWNKMRPDQRKHLRSLGVDMKRLRRPSFISVSSGSDDVPPEVAETRCNVGAEGVMVHVDEEYVHLAFKCGNPHHPYHYSTFGIETVAAMAKACETAWPGSIARPLIEHVMDDETKVALFGPPVLDPGESDEDLEEDEAEEVEEIEDDEEDDLYI